MRVKVGLTPLEEVSAPLGIVIDVLRATSTICQALASGYERVVCVGEIEDARVWAEILRQHTALHPEFSFLPRKFKFAITASDHDRAAIKIHDVGLRLCRLNVGLKRAKFLPAHLPKELPELLRQELLALLLLLHGLDHQVGFQIGLRSGILAGNIAHAPSRNRGRGKTTPRHLFRQLLLLCPTLRLEVSHRRLPLGGGFAFPALLFQMVQFLSRRPRLTALRPQVLEPVHATDRPGARKPVVGRGNAEMGIRGGRQVQRHSEARALKQARLPDRPVREAHCLRPRGCLSRNGQPLQQGDGATLAVKPR